jgi:hypothetical protein
MFTKFSRTFLATLAGATMQVPAESDQKLVAVSPIVGKVRPEASLNVSPSLPADIKIKVEGTEGEIFRMAKD